MSLAKIAIFALAEITLYCVFLQCPQHCVEDTLSKLDWSPIIYLRLSYCFWCNSTFEIRRLVST